MLIPLRRTGRSSAATFERPSTSAPLLNHPIFTMAPLLQDESRALERGGQVTKVNRRHEIRSLKDIRRYAEIAEAGVFGGTNKANGRVSTCFPQKTIE